MLKSFIVVDTCKLCDVISSSHSHIVCGVASSSCCGCSWRSFTHDSPLQGVFTFESVAEACRETSYVTFALLPTVCCSVFVCSYGCQTTSIKTILSQWPQLGGYATIWLWVSVAGLVILCT